MKRADEPGLGPPQGLTPKETGDEGRADRSLAARVQRRGPGLLRICVGAVFLWFGVLKFFPAASPAEQVAVRAATKLTFGLLSPDVVLRALATSETAIGLGLVTGVLLRVALMAFFVHMAGVFSTLLLLAGDMWQGGGPVPTLEGQYIIKNVVLIAACLVVAADERTRAATTRTPPSRSPIRSSGSHSSNRPAHRSPRQDQAP
ncbi:DoxX family membrane protein [Streptomyces pratensis]|uniref:DoxX family membrane protein n=1 Tax=Streptomyces pratensis TaxID=1169025 RepID=UPI0030167F7D